MVSIPMVVIGAVLAALIAGFFSFLNLVISKEQKVSEFRQNWIDALRDEISQYVAAISFIASANLVAVKDPSSSELREHWLMLKDAFDHAARSYSSIVLRLNPDDSDQSLRCQNVLFLSKLNEVRDLVRSSKYQEAKKQADELTPLAQPILKYEWERVKAGEKIFRYTRNLAALIVLFAIVFGMIFVSSKANSDTNSGMFSLAMVGESNVSELADAGKTQRNTSNSINKRNYRLEKTLIPSCGPSSRSVYGPNVLDALREPGSWGDCSEHPNSGLLKKEDEEEQPVSAGEDKLPKP